jgi:hypothetical protein
MKLFLCNVVPWAVAIIFYGSSVTSKEISMLEDPRVLNYGYLFHNYRHSLAHMHQLLVGKINNYLHPTNYVSFPPTIYFLIPKARKSEKVSMRNHE